MSKDPILFNGGINLYGYANNDPVNFIDINGKNPVLVAIGAGAFVGAAANLIGNAMAGNLSSRNFTETAVIGGISGAAAVWTSGALAGAATATTLAQLLAVDVTSGFTSTLASTVLDLGLNAIYNSPPPGVTAKELSTLGNAPQCK